jgi:hypothetical protein
MSLNACKATSEEEASLLTLHDGHPLQPTVMGVERERSMTFSDDHDHELRRETVGANIAYVDRT